MLNLSLDVDSTMIKTFFQHFVPAGMTQKLSMTIFDKSITHEHDEDEKIIIQYQIQ
jgi:hypothetical protein